MTDYTTDGSLRRTAGIAGLAFLVIVTGYTLTWIFVYSRLIAAGDVTATAGNIMANPSLFRTGIAGDLLIAISGIVLTVALYILLKPVDRNLALLALSLKLADAVLAAVTVSLSFIALELLTGEAFFAVSNPEQVQDLVGLFLSLHAAASTIPMVFTSLGFIVFFSLFLKSEYIPGILAGFGIFSYGLLLIYSFITILGAIPAAPHLGSFDIIIFAPSILFELAIGLWLLLKGIKVP
jgi:predicted aconitase with swiveling domain